MTSLKVLEGDLLVVSDLAVLKEPLRVEINVDEGGADLIGERGAEGSGIEAVLRVLAEEADRLEAVLKTAKRGESKRILKGKDEDGMFEGRRTDGGCFELDGR
jgi:hypothetical protein